MITDVGASFRAFSRSASALLAVACLVAAGAAAESAPQTADALLEALRTTTDEDARVEILSALAEYRSEPVRLALEAIAGDGAEPGSVRMQAICSLSGSATADSVPLLIGIAETDMHERHGYWACAIPLLGQIRDRRAMPLLLASRASTTTISSAWTTWPWRRSPTWPTRATCRFS